VEQLELILSDEQIKDVTSKIKELADVRTQSMDDVDTVLRVCESILFSSTFDDNPELFFLSGRLDHRGITSGDLKIRQKEIFDSLLAAHKSA
jgi:homocitrate synthase